MAKERGIIPPEEADRVDRTIAAFMDKRGVRVGVSLQGETPDSAAANEPVDRKYAVGRKVAEGGMGAILEARDADIRRRVRARIDQVQRCPVCKRTQPGFLRPGPDEIRGSLVWHHRRPPRRSR